MNMFTSKIINEKQKNNNNNNIETSKGRILPTQKKNRIMQTGS